VPRFFSGLFFAMASWPKLFFPFGTKFSPVLITGYQVSYGAWTRCGPQRWTDSSTNEHGNLPWTGTSRAASGAKTAVTCEPMGPYHGSMGFT
jgi:hypothetical protein